MVHVGEGTEKLPTLVRRVEHPVIQLPGWSIEWGWNTNSQTLPLSSLQRGVSCHQLGPSTKDLSSMGSSWHKLPVALAQFCHDPQSSRKNKDGGSSLVVQRLRLSTFIAMGLGSIPGRRTKIPQVAWCSQKIKIKVGVITVWKKRGSSCKINCLKA